jgi:Ca-activated chloride channel homolog
MRTGDLRRKTFPEIARPIVLPSREVGVGSPVSATQLLPGHLIIRSVLCAAALAFTPVARAQSADPVADPVHVVPRDVPPAIADDPGLRDGEPRLRYPPLRVDVDLVLVPVSVTDTMNRPMVGLEKQNFQLYENDEQQEIRFFSAEDSPISVGLILDLSKSMDNKFVTERTAVEEFFNNANPRDDYFVITFSDSPKLLTSSTQSIDDIEQKLAANIPDGHTALLDAIYLAIARMHSARYSRRALLIISDGGDNHSRYGLKEIKSLAAEADVGIYAIGIFDSVVFRSFEEFMGKRWLGQITDVTGGRTVAAGELARVPEIAAALSREMRNQYVLGYRPRDPARDGKWRRIKVQVTPATGAEPAQTYYKKGYRAPAE